MMSDPELADRLTRRRDYGLMIVVGTVLMMLGWSAAQGGVTQPEPPQPTSAKQHECLAPSGPPKHYSSPEVCLMARDAIEARAKRQIREKQRQQKDETR